MESEADYELMLLLDASIPEDERRDAINGVERELIDLDIEVVNSEQYDVRPLAYPIKGAKRGHYHLFEINVPSGAHDELQERLNLVESILRYLFVRKREIPETFEEEDEEEGEEEASEAGEIDPEAEADDESDEEPDAESEPREDEATEPAVETAGG